MIKEFINKWKYRRKGYNFTTTKDFPVNYPFIWWGRINGEWKCISVRDEQLMIDGLKIK